MVETPSETALAAMALAVVALTAAGQVECTASVTVADEVSAALTLAAVAQVVFLQVDCAARAAQAEGDEAASAKKLTALAPAVKARAEGDERCSSMSGMTLSMVLVSSMVSRMAAPLVAGAAIAAIAAALPAADRLGWCADDGSWMVLTCLSMSMMLKK